MPIRIGPRMSQVRELLYKGYSNKGIAIRLGISEGSAKYHVKQIYGEHGVRNREELRALLNKARAAGG